MLSIFIRKQFPRDKFVTGRLHTEGRDSLSKRIQCIYRDTALVHEEQVTDSNGTESCGVLLRLRFDRATGECVLTHYGKDLHALSM
jgi:hypothetical protein